MLRKRKWIFNQLPILLLLLLMMITKIMITMMMMMKIIKSTTVVLVSIYVLFVCHKFLLRVKIFILVTRHCQSKTKQKQKQNKQKANKTKTRKKFLRNLKVKSKPPRRETELWSSAWQAGILTTILPRKNRLTVLMGRVFANGRTSYQRL